MASLASDRVRARRASHVRPGNHRATVLTTPDTLGDSVSVRLRSEAREIRHEIRAWMPRGTDMPAEGDTALVAVDDEGHMWIVAWEPVS
jgi:hypothetical protein